MATIRLVLNEVGRQFPSLKECAIVSDKCTSFQSYEQIIFVTNGNVEGWFTAEHPEPLAMRVTQWQHTESQSGRDTLDTHFAFLSMAHAKFLRFNGDIITPEQMFEATSTYAPKNTSVVLADTSHKSIAKFDVPKLQGMTQEKGN
jgi:hypothetical protein